MDSGISSIVASTGCSADEAAAAYYQAGGDVRLAISIVSGRPNDHSGRGIACPGTVYQPANTESEICRGDGSARVVKYSDGLLVNGVFYDYSVPGNRALLDMLGRNEFDKDVLGLDCSEALITVEDRCEPFNMRDLKDNLSKDDHASKKIRREEKTARGRIINEEFGEIGLNLPETVDLRGDGTDDSVVFKVLNRMKTTTFVVPGNMLVRDVVAYLHGITGLDLRLCMRGAVLDEGVRVTAIDRCLVEVIL